MDEKMKEAMETLLHFLKKQDPLIDEAIKRSGVTPTCKRGCAHCCSMLATIHVMEGLLLAREALKLPSWRRIAMKARSASIAGRGIYDTAEYFAKGIECPLLDPESKDCMVYEARPGPCRQHFAASPPEMCDPAFNTGRQPVSLFDGHQFVKVTLKLCCELAGCLMSASLPLMLLWCMGKMAPDKDKKLFQKLVRDLPTPTDWFRVAMVIEEVHAGQGATHGQESTDSRSEHA